MRLVLRSVVCLLRSVMCLLRSFMCLLRIRYVSVTFCYLLSGGFCERDHPGIAKVCKRWRQYNPPLGHQPFSCDGKLWRRPLLSIETQWHHLLSKSSLCVGSIEFA